jgi:hypothetical protein
MTDAKLTQTPQRTPGSRFPARQTGPVPSLAIVLALAIVLGAPIAWTQRHYLRALEGIGVVHAVVGQLNLNPTGGNLGIGTITPNFQLQTTSNIESLGALNNPYGGLGLYQNRITQSEAIDTWNKVNTTTVANSVAAPNGETAADTVTSTVSNGYIYDGTTGGTVSGNTYTFSFWARTASGSQTIQYDIAECGYDGGRTNTSTATTTWQRYSVTRSSWTNGAGSPCPVIYPVSGGTGSLYIWGGQNEIGVTKAGPYVKTSGTAITGSNGLVASSATGNSLFYGNVGIGTTGPGAKLESQATTEQLRLSYDSASPVKFTVDSAGSLTVDASKQGNNFLRFKVSGAGNPSAESLTIKGTSGGIGLTGINNTNPAYALDVTGEGQFTNGSLFLGSTSVGTYPGASLLSLDGTSLYARNTNGNGNPRDVYKIDQGWQVNTQGSEQGAIIFKAATPHDTFSTTLSEVMRIVGATTDNGGGNVGIGTTGPSGKLNVSNTTEQLRLSYDATHYSSFTTEGNGDLLISPSSTGTYFGTWGGSGSVLITNGIISANGTSNNYFAGNVGLGTTGPLYKLDILSPTNTAGLNIRYGRNTTQNDYASLVFTDTTGGPIYNEIRSIRNAGASSFDLAFSQTNFGGSVTEAMRISTTGNVGIGTTAPLTKFHLQDTQGTGGTSLTTPDAIVERHDAATPVNNIETALGLYTGRTDMNIATESARLSAVMTDVPGRSSDMVFSTLHAGTLAEKMRLDTNGNVGIGTTGPGALLDLLTTSSTKQTLNVTSSKNGGAAFNFTDNSETNGSMFTLSDSGLTSGTALDITLGSNMTSGKALKISGDSYAPAAGATGSLVSLALISAPTNTSGTSITNGILISPQFTAGLSSTGIGEIYGVKIADIIDTVIPGGTPNTYGVRIGNQGGSNITNTYGLYVDSQSGSTNNFAAIFAGGNVGIGTTAPATLFSLGGANGQQFGIHMLTELTTIAAAASTDTAITFPLYSLPLAASVRVTTAIPTAGLFDVGIPGANTMWDGVTPVSTALNSIGGGTNTAAIFATSTTRAVRITPNLTPAANTGRVRVTIWYMLSTPPTS